MTIEISTKNGLICLVPEEDSQDSTPKFTNNDDFQKIKNFYKSNGFVIFKGVLSSDICNDFRDSWDKEVKNYPGFLYRQATAKLEKNIKNQNNWIMNPILNIQSLDKKVFRDLTSNFEKNIVNNKSISLIVNKILGNKPTIVQSMYFEGNSATWEHQDSYYLDDEDTGEMIAGWLALEDIDANSGRFFVCPKSHLEDYSKMGLENLITENHSKYINSIVKIVKENKLEVIAPKLNTGDLLLWNSLTIHGSLDSQSLTNSRSSITFHAIKSGSRFKVLRNILRDLKVEKTDCFDIFRPNFS